MKMFLATNIFFANSPGFAFSNERMEELNIPKLVEELYSLAFENSDWIHHEKTENGASIFIRKDLKFGTSKGVGLVKAPLRYVFDVITKGDLSEFDTSYDGHVEIEKLNESATVSYLKTKLSFHPLNIKPRDFCVYSHIEGSSDQSIVILSTSCKHHRVPEIETHLRANLGVNGWILSRIPGDPTFCKVFKIVQIDLLGSLPNWVIEKFLISQCFVLERLKIHCEEKISQREINYILSQSALHIPSQKEAVVVKMDESNTLHPGGKEKKVMLGPRTSEVLRQQKLRRKESGIILGESTVKAAARSQRNRQLKKSQSNKEISKPKREMYRLSGQRFNLVDDQVEKTPHVQNLVFL